MWGDPHINTFDGGHLDIYDEGVFWVVKTMDIHIQGLFLATQFTHGLSATNTLAVSGPFINDNELRVPPLNGQITWNGQPILETFPSSFTLPNDLGEIVYNGEGELVDGAMAQYGDKRIVHIDLPEMVHIQIMRWSNHINVRIEMPLQPGLDGLCGNFDGDPGDDTIEAVFMRMGRGVSQGESIVGQYAPFKPAPPITLDDCPADKRASAEQLCKMDRPGIADRELSACITDVCFGGQQYALQDSAY